MDVKRGRIGRLAESPSFQSANAATVRRDQSAFCVFTSNRCMFKTSITT
jgi:hypothetical protein